MKGYDGAAGKADKGNEGAGDWLPFHCSYSRAAQINADGNGGKDTRNESTEKKVPCTLRCVCVAVKSS